jgi:hypothetical protein
VSPRKEYFDEPLVKVDFQKARFPRTCPVCGNPATKVERLKIAKTGKQYNRRTWLYPSARIHRLVGQQQSEMKVLLVQVCEEHANPDAGTDRYQSLCVAVDGFLLVFVIFSLLIVGDRIARARPIPLWSVFYFGLFGFALVLSLVAFSPNVLERAVGIVGFDPGMQNVLLAFKRPDYRNQFMDENQMTAELVTWIMRLDD